VVEPAVTAAGFDLEDLRDEAAGRRRVLRIVVDADGGVDLDGVAELSRAVSAALDESDVMGGTPYVLEVTSPGVDRPLTAERHWRRAVGRLVRVRPVAEGATEFTGRVRDADGDGAVLDVDGDVRRVAYAEVASARVQIEFARHDAVDDAAVEEDGDEG
jgi:ribosome maturation factor RimP